MYKTHHGAEFDHTRLSLSHMRLAETHTALLLYGTQTAQVMPDADGQRPRGTDPATTPRSDTALRQLALKNYALAHRDELTGLSNRRHFMAAVDRLIDGRLPHGLTLGLLDLDDFKLVNDTYGHPVGDALLISLASRLRQHLDPTAQIARLGGDEFAFVYQRGPHADMAQHRCDALCKALNSPHEVNGFTLPVTASIGFAHSPEMAATRTQLLKHADFALYDAKQTRKGTAVAFCASHQKCMQRQTTLQQAFACADLAHELKLEYQPVFDRLS
ncbi:MAG: GGDEF domain-containing protein [Pseudomonadota bacterium]